MENKFDEREFLASVKQLHSITPYLCSNPVAEHFIDTVRLHCGFDEVEMYSYFKTLLDKNCPDLKATCIDVKGWKKIYNVFISQHDDKAGEIMKTGIDFFKSPDLYERYYNLVNEACGIQDVYVAVYLIHKMGWIRLVDTLVKMALEMYPDEEATDDTVEDVVECTETTSELELTSVVDGVKEPTTPEADTTISEPEKVDVVGTTIIPKKSISKKDKRGYNIPVHQYKRELVFETIEAASVSTGVALSNIVASVEHKPTSVVERIWKYTDKTKTKVSLYTHLHTYTNQSDIDRTSQDVCGKKIYHSNVVPQLKDWKSICKSDYVWFQLDDVSKLSEGGNECEKSNVSMEQAA